jgi:hypothetical protein
MMQFNQKGLIVNKYFMAKLPRLKLQNIYIYIYSIKFITFVCLCVC